MGGELHECSQCAPHEGPWLGHVQCPSTQSPPARLTAEHHTCGHSERHRLVSQSWGLAVVEASQSLKWRKGLSGVDDAVQSLYEKVGDWYVPSGLTTGPWRSDAMHGGAPGALVGALVTAAVGEGEQVARVEIDLERPVPLEPMLGLVRRRQVSRRVAHLEIELSTKLERVVSARAVLTQREPVSVDAEAWSPPQGPDHLDAMDWDLLYPNDSGPIFVRDAVEHRVVRGGYGVPVPSAAWLRLKVPVVHGAEPCGLSQLLGVGDFGSPLSQTNSIGPGLALINIDLNATLFRQPTGPWFFLDATGHVGQGGLGLAVTDVFDLEGRIGVITQSQIAYRLARNG